jgi:hypothetical protein
LGPSGALHARELRLALEDLGEVHKREQRLVEHVRSARLLLAVPDSLTPERRQRIAGRHRMEFVEGPR